MFSPHFLIDDNHENVSLAIPLIEIVTLFSIWLYYLLDLCMSSLQLFTRGITQVTDDRLKNAAVTTRSSPAIIGVG